MTDILSLARAHFANMDRRRIEVPEWGTPEAPAVMFAPSLTLADRQNIERRAKGDAVGRIVTTVILHTLREDGTRVFADDAATRKALEREVDPEIVARIATEILRASGSDDLEK